MRSVEESARTGAAAASALLDRASEDDRSLRQKTEVLAPVDHVRSSYLQCPPLEGMLRSQVSPDQNPVLATVLKPSLSPESDPARLIGQTISHYRIISKLGG